MNIWENTVLTDKGKALQAKLLQGQTLKISRVTTGSKKIPIVDLRQQTDVTEGGYDITLQPSRTEGEKTILPVLLENTGLKESYDLWQVGFFAEDPDEGEILFCISQASQAKHVPSEAESPGYSVTWNFYFNTSNTVPFEVVLDSSGLVNIEAYRKHTEAISEVNRRADDLDLALNNTTSALKADKTSLDNTNSQLDKFANRKILINRGSVSVNASSTVDARVNFTEAFSSTPIIVIGLEGAVMNRRVSAHTVDRSGFTVTARNDSTTKCDGNSAEKLTLLCRAVLISLPGSSFLWRLLFSSPPLLYQTPPGTQVQPASGLLCTWRLCPRCGTSAVFQCHWSILCRDSCRCTLKHMYSSSSQFLLRLFEEKAAEAAAFLLQQPKM